jgi:hypothetical protein
MNISAATGEPANGDAKAFESFGGGRGGIRDPVAELPAASPRRRLWLELGILLLLALLAVGRSAFGTRLDGVTVDEPWHIVAAVEYVRTGDFRLNPEHPPLTKLWVGAAMPENFVLRPKAPLAEKGAERDLVEETFFYDNDFLAAQRRARLAMWAFHVLLLVAIGFLLSRACGLAWAAGTLLFIALEPTVGAHLPVVMTDLPLALTLLLAALCAGRLSAGGWSWRAAAALGLSMGLALGAKHSALPGLAGIAAFVLAASLFRSGSGGRRFDLGVAAGRIGRAAFAGILALGLLWAFYGLRFHAAPDGSDGFNRPMAAKVGDLQIPAWRRLIERADEWRLLPRAYLWGLADTVRAGVEGRGQNSVYLWGETVKGAPPWYTWPSFVGGKVPLALLGLTLLGGVVVCCEPARRESAELSRLAALAAIGAMATAHLLALAGSQGSYAGVRHALPLVVAMAVVAGAAASFAWRRRSRYLGGAVVLLFVATAAMTLGAPRLWEYHNELAGGSRDGWRYFRNEGNDLGQRSLELADFHRRAIAPTGQKLYSDYWFAEESAKALGMNFARRVTSLDDENVAGEFEGFFFYLTISRLPEPELDWDPDKEFAGLEPVARFGAVEVWRGRQLSPRSRAGSLRAKLLEYIYEEKGEDWALVASRLEEVLAVNSYDFSVAIELGNAYLRLGNRQAALRAYRQPFTQAARDLLDGMTRASLLQRVASLERGDALELLPPLRNPWME